MIKSRDFLLYVVVFCFIVIGIVFTIANDTRQKTGSESTPSVATTEGTELGAFLATDSIDRARNLALLKEKIAEGQGVISQGPPVMTSVDTPTTTERDDDINQDSPAFLGERTVQRCQIQSPDTISATWPDTGVSIRATEGARLVQETAEVAATSGSSTATTTSLRTLIQLPTLPYKETVPRCIDSEIIGIAVDGTLIKNADTWRFRTVPASGLIGYARDGFPIYGAADDTYELDACGGTIVNGVYAYHLRSDELFILGCFAAMPHQFIR